MALLSVNAGSSSLKVTLFSSSSPGKAQATIALEEIHSMTEAVKTVLSRLTSEYRLSLNDIEAIGHRVVHGGPRHASATWVDDELIAYLENITPLAPNHMPNTLTALRAFLQAYPTTPQVACFDTGFFHDVPAVAQTLPLPIALQRELGIRRYGFHGLSYEYLLYSFRQHEGEVAARGRVIMAHLGSGASVAALKDGQPLDMSMGFTPVSGVMMSTRSGDIEPGVLTYIQKRKDLSNDELANLVTNQSGLLGVSGMTAEMYSLLQSQHDHPGARLAVELFCSRIQKTIGGFVAVLGGVDSIIFTGGIGERSAEIRGRICQALTFAGVAIDKQRNAGNERLISANTSAVGVHVIPAQENHTIITQTLALIRKDAS